MSGGFKRLYRGETDIDFIGKRKLWFTISGTLVVLAILVLATRQLNFGIEFEGGVSIQAPIAEDGPLGDQSDLEVIESMRDALGEFGAAEAQIQVATQDDERTVLVQTKEVDDPEQQAAVVAAVAEESGVEVADTDSQRIGSKWGAEITTKAVRALVIFVLVVFGFLAWRFEWKMGVAAIVALIHDLIITAGIYSLVGFEVTPSTVIALLTILGYSLYDTVVVFDKVEEDATLFATTGKMTYQGAANLAVNQVFMRSINTSLATLLPVGALLFVGVGLLGAQTLQDLALALLVGIGVSSYSSVFVATPVLSLWKEREPRFRSVRDRMARDASRKLGAMEPPEEELVGASGTTTLPSTTPTMGSPRPPARSRVGSKKAKRRKRK
jgi:preprotein translocase subunit SecF